MFLTGLNPIYFDVANVKQRISVLNSSDVGLLLKEAGVVGKKYGVDNLQASTNSSKYRINNTRTRTKP